MVCSLLIAMGLLWNFVGKDFLRQETKLKISPHVQYKSNHLDTDISELLPQITSILIKGLYSELKEAPAPGALIEPVLPGFFYSDRCSSFNNRAVDAGGAKQESIPLSIVHRQRRFTSMHYFVRSLSLSFNNLLMGILGNVTLMGMDMSAGQTSPRPIVQLERLITSGANVVHLIFGYLAERRMKAKKLQLQQLIGAIDNYMQAVDGKIDLKAFEESMLGMSSVDDRKKISGCLATLIEQLLLWIDAQLRVVFAESTDINSTENRRKAIRRLLARGFGIVTNLRLFANEITPNKRRMSLRTLIAATIERAAKRHGHIAVSGDVPRKMPWFRGDRNQIEYGLTQLIDNAEQSMPDGGRLHIRLRTLQDEPPQARCAVHRPGNYAVITISDNGNGMDMDTQACIFYPFFTKYPCQQINHTGLGLAGVSAIVKNHGGYLRLRSEPDKGTQWQVYLPVEAGLQ